MQVNVPEGLVTDPRLREVATALAWHRHRVLGALVEIMQEGLRTRSPELPLRRVDGYADHLGFARALCDADLATEPTPGTIRLADGVLAKQLEWLAGQDSKRAAANAKRRELADQRGGVGASTGTGTGTESVSDKETETRAGTPPGPPPATPPGRREQSSGGAVDQLLSFVSAEHAANGGKAWKPTPKAREKARGDLHHLVCSGFSELEIQCRARAYFSDRYRPDWLTPPFTVAGFLSRFDDLSDAAADVEADARADAARRSQAAGVK